MQSEHWTINDCWRRRVLLVFELPISTQLCSNGSPQSTEELLNGLCHSLSVDLSNTAWALTRLIYELFKNTFGTITRIRPWKSATQPDAGFGPKNPWRSHKWDSTMKTYGQVMVLHLVLCQHIKHIVAKWQTVVLHLVLWSAQTVQKHSITWVIIVRWTTFYSNR